MQDVAWRHHAAYRWGQLAFSESETLLIWIWWSALICLDDFSENSDFLQSLLGRWDFFHVCRSGRLIRFQWSFQSLMCAITLWDRSTVFKLKYQGCRVRQWHVYILKIQNTFVFFIYLFSSIYSIQAVLPVHSRNVLPVRLDQLAPRYVVLALYCHILSWKHSPHGVLWKESQAEGKKLMFGVKVFRVTEIFVHAKLFPDTLNKCS